MSERLDFVWHDAAERSLEAMYQRAIKAERDRDHYLALWTKAEGELERMRADAGSVKA